MRIAIHLLLVTILFAAEGSFAQSGTLDTSFGNDGKVLTEFGELDSSVQSIGVQADGKIIAGGTVLSHNYSYLKFALARYNTDGSLDTTFGVYGKSVIDFGEMLMSLKAIVLQSDGKIIASGTLYGESNSQFVLVRYSSDGTLDTTFGVDGMVTTYIGGVSNKIAALALQSDGKIIATGYTSDNDSNSDFALVRYDSEGNLDTSFGNNGIVITSLSMWDYGNALALQSDQKIIVAGSSSDGIDTDFAMARYLANGVLDPDFGTAGKVVLSSAEYDAAAVVKIQVDKKIIVAGQSGSSFTIMQLDSKGDLDNEFGNNGKVTATFGGSLKAMEIQTDGKIVTAGSFLNTEGYNTIGLSRYNATGDLDAPFGDNGTIITPFNISSQGNALVLGDNEKIIIGGYAGNPMQSDFALLRYNAVVTLGSTVYNDSKKGFTVYPNPVSQTINLDFNLKQSQVLSMDLYDSNGRKISNLVNNVNFQSGYNSQKIALPETLSKGIYFLNISNGSDASILKIVK